MTRKSYPGRGNRTDEKRFGRGGQGNPEDPLEIFFSYSHKDEDLRDALESHLATLKRNGQIRTWHDRRITGGLEWAGDIDRHLESADVVLLLVSADFISSDYCWDVEIRRAIDRHQKGETRVVPVILRPADWQKTPFGKLQALPRNARPVVKWDDRDEAFLDVAQGLRAIIQEISDNRLHSPKPPQHGVPPRRKQFNASLAVLAIMVVVLGILAIAQFVRSPEGDLEETYTVDSSDVAGPSLKLTNLDPGLLLAVRNTAKDFAAGFARRASAEGWLKASPTDSSALANEMRRALNEKPDFFLRILLETRPALGDIDWLPLIQLVEGRLPGEHLLVNRMLLGVVERLNYGRFVKPERILFFDLSPEGTFAPEGLLRRLRSSDGDCETLRMSFGAGKSAPLDVSLDYLQLTDGTAYLVELRRLNCPRERASGILINDCYEQRGMSPLEILRNVLVVEEILRLNPALPLTVDGFQPGLEVKLPDPARLEANTHIVDASVAKLFYESQDYFFAFENHFELAYGNMKALVDHDAWSGP